MDFIAASFTRNAEDIAQIRQLLKENGGKILKLSLRWKMQRVLIILMKLLKFLTALWLPADMGVEIFPEEEVPILQKMIIQKVCSAGKIVITATQMLDSMIKNPRPTRAETTDVANAIFDGTSAIMLSGETADAYSVESLKTMAKIALRAEKAINYQKRFTGLTLDDHPGVTDAICHATCSTAYDLHAKAIITVTKSGFSASNDIPLPSGMRHHRLRHG